MSDDKGKKDSGGKKEGNGGKERGNDKQIIRRPFGDSVPGNNDNTNSTGPRSPSNGKK